MVQRWLSTSLVVLMLCTSSCGDGGGAGGLAGVGGVGGTLGGTGTTSILYVTNSGSNNVSGYTINSVTGVLAAISGSPFPTGSWPSAMAVSSNGFFAYVANGQANTVTAFRISTEGGLLIVLPTTDNPNPVSVGTAPSALAISPDTQHLYVASRSSATVTAFTIGAGGVLTLVSPTGSNLNPVAVDGSAPESLAISQNGKFLYAANSGSNDITAFSIASSGLLTKIPPAGSHANPLASGGTTLQGIAATPNALFLYAVHSSSNTVTAFHIESNGLLTLVPVSGTGQNPIPVGSSAPGVVLMSRNGRFLYSANGGGTITAFSIGVDGLLSRVSSSGGQVNPVSTGTSPIAMAVSLDGQYLYAANSGGRVSAYTLSDDTGLLTPLSPLVGNPFLAGTSPSGIATPGSP
ncbi:MAG: lactonase family protein [Acetobacteraceae bacterium]|nr:lactonase family protein [Acetobacteraceae bacterium]